MTDRTPAIAALLRACAPDKCRAAQALDRLLPLQLGNSAPTRDADNRAATACDYWRC
ncbi:MAG: hypothetical protein U5L03_09300 [Burkholderiaceae bacterium]|nr:hypothetical protein [Burkholderiaceae bacterium]